MDLLEIEPGELRFSVEAKKQSSCLVQLVNKSSHLVAFKVKTTSPKKYCVKPNVGIVKPKSICEFRVTMQALRVVPPDLICRDKFLVQSTVVSNGTTDEDITPSLFSTEDGRYIEERKLKVILLSPPPSPAASSPVSDGGEQNDDQTQDRPSSPKGEVPDKADVPVKDETNTVDSEKMKSAYADELKQMWARREKELVKDLEISKSKLSEVELKLKQAEAAMAKIMEERDADKKEVLERILNNNTPKEERRQQQQQNEGVVKIQVGFPFLFVCMVAFLSVVLGYLFHG